MYVTFGKHIKAVKLKGRDCTGDKQRMNVVDKELVARHIDIRPFFQPNLSKNAKTVPKSYLMYLMPGNFC